MALDYLKQRSDGTTISQLRSLIYNEDLTIADLHKRIALCLESRADYISRLSNDERIQLVADNSELFPKGLPTTTEIPFVYEGQPDTSTTTTT